MKTLRTQELTKISLCVALLAVFAYISFPLPFTPAPVTALTIIVNLIGFIMPAKEAFMTMSVYTFIGAIGLPVFTNGGAGIARILGPTGGFIIGFWLAAPIIAYLRNGSTEFKKLAMLGIVVGMPIIYFCGFISMNLVLKLSFWATMTTAVIPFLFGDVVKVLVAAFLAKKVGAVIKFDK